MVSWNARPEYLQKQPGSKSVRKSIKTLLLLAASFVLAAKYSSALFDKNASAFVIGTCYTAAAILGALALQSLTAMWETKPLLGLLNAEQRKLIGVEAPAHVTAPGPPKQRGLDPIVTPPSRTARPVLHPVVIGEEVQAAQLRTPGSRGSIKNMTPDQLQRLMNELDQHADAAANAATGAAPGAGEFGGMFGAPSVVQPMPSPSSTYRPSATPKGTAAAPIRSDGRVTQSLPSQRNAVMEELGVSEDSREEGTEHLREWFASDVLQPLHAAIVRAHADVIDATAQLGIPGVRLTPLDFGTENATKAADDSLLLAQIREWMRNLANRNSPELPKCLQAIITYQKLLLLLRGEFPSGLLPPTPDGYILERIKELANGSCMMEFKWDDGGDWAGKPWSTEMPTDSALIFYLFAAFLAAPQWTFTDEDPCRIEGPNGVLYLGKIPPRVSGEYFAIIPTRPPPGSKGTGIVGLQLGTQQPHFCLLQGGEILLTESGQGALFCILVLFLHHCHKHGGTIGGRSLDYLNLGSVVDTSLFSSLRRFRNALRLW